MLLSSSSKWIAIACSAQLDPLTPTFDPNRTSTGFDPGLFPTLCYWLGLNVQEIA